MLYFQTFLGWLAGRNSVIEHLFPYKREKKYVTIPGNVIEETDVMVVPYRVHVQNHGSKVKFFCYDLPMLSSLCLGVFRSGAMTANYGKIVMPRFGGTECHLKHNATSFLDCRL